MENLLKSASIITVGLLRAHPNPSTEKIAELLGQSLDALEIATGRLNTRNAKKNAEMKMSKVVTR